MRALSSIGARQAAGKPRRAAGWQGPPCIVLAGGLDPQINKKTGTRSFALHKLDNITIATTPTPKSLTHYISHFHYHPYSPTLYPQTITFSYVFAVPIVHHKFCIHGHPALDECSGR